MDSLQSDNQGNWPLHENTQKPVILCRRPFQLWLVVISSYSSDGKPPKEDSRQFFYKINYKKPPDAHSLHSALQPIVSIGTFAGID